jgi:general nucleoside transport system permease protein
MVDDLPERRDRSPAVPPPRPTDTPPTARPATDPGGPRTPKEAQRWRAALSRIWALSAVPLAAIVFALIAGTLLIIGSSFLAVGRFEPTLPLTAYRALLEGSLGIGARDPFIALRSTMVNTAPLLLAGLAVGLGFKAGLFNIGATGQLIMGGFTAAVVGAFFATDSPYIAIPAAVVAGGIAGAIWGFIPGFLKAFTGAHEVVTTIMLNFIAGLTVSALVQGPFRAPGYTFARTADIGNATLPQLFGMHLGVYIALAFIPIMAWLIWRTTLGFEIRAVGANPSAARYAGMSPRRLITLTMSLCGMLAGLSGVILILGQVRSFPATFGTGIGFDAIAVALLGRAHPVGIFFGALLFGGMRAGAPLMQVRAQVPIQVIDILQALILLFLAADLLVRQVLRIRAERAGVDELQTVTRTYGEQAVR